MVARNMNLIAAVGYARRSTDLQERSIPDQKAYVEKWAKEHGYEIVRWFIDDAISGTSAKGRNAFEQMIASAENGRDFQTVLCYDISRFSRGGTNETGFYLHRLKLAGVDVLFTADGIPEGDEGELIQGVKSWQARQYSVKLARDTIRGQISNIKERKCAPGGVAPFGYDKQHLSSDGKVLRTFRWLADGRKQEFDSSGKMIRVLAAGETVKKAKSDIVRYVLSTPERVAVIKRIFKQCVSGFGYNHIAYRLNDDGIESPAGSPWNASVVSRILANPAYRGALVWNKRTLAKINGVAGDGTLRPKCKQQVANNAESDWFIVENVHEPIITAEMFAKAREAVAGRRDLGGLAKPINRSLLSGLIVCNHCGHNYLQKKVNSVCGGQRVKYRYYTDGGYNRGGKTVCQLTNIPADALDAFVIAKVREVIIGEHKTTDTAIKAFVRNALTNQPSGDDGTSLDRELERLAKRIQATVAMLTDPDLADLSELKATLLDLKAKRETLEAKRRDVCQPTGIIHTEPQLRSWANDRFDDFTHLANGNPTFDTTRRVLHTYVQKIEIDPKAKRGTLILPADLLACWQSEFSTRPTLGDPRGGIKSKGEI